MLISKKKIYMNFEDIKVNLFNFFYKYNSFFKFKDFQF
jgi:hypothetical protein